MGRAGRRGEEGEFVKVLTDLFGLGDEGGSLANQVVAAFGLGAVDGARDGVDGAAGFGSHPGSDEGAGAAWAFGDEEGGRPVGYDAVALGEGLFVGRAA